MEEICAVKFWPLYFYLELTLSPIEELCQAFYDLLSVPYSSQRAVAYWDSVRVVLLFSSPTIERKERKKERKESFMDNKAHPG